MRRFQQPHWSDVWGYDDVHGGFGFGDRNGGGTSLLDCTRAFDLVIANSSFPKKVEHLVTFWSSVSVTQIDYLLYRKSDIGLCTDCKVIPSKNLMTLHRCVLMDLEITRKRRKIVVYSQPRIKWGALIEAKAQGLECIRKATREVLGISKCYSGGHRGDRWWNGEVKEKVDTKKAAYLKLVENVDEEERRVNKVQYKLAKEEAKLVATTAKTALLVI
uniref:Craniofacial development protein 2-like n=1 Tax=Nicotiana tabacum TaxID=4097 RepID=A0A1S3YXN1_TOBAC|nr:PREDICTED: uncharacterized protein LOC107780775 [Nicotiana tabacum]